MGIAPETGYLVAVAFVRSSHDVEMQELEI